MSASGSGSVEISVPTDLTVTSEADSDDIYTGIASRRNARDMQTLVAERVEFQRLIEKQKLVLQSRDAQITALLAQQQTALEYLASQKDNTISGKQITINRLQVEVERSKDELNMIRERAARELAQLTQKCVGFQDTQKRLSVKHDRLRDSLSTLTMNKEEYDRLQNAPQHLLNLQQYTALRVYEMVWPLRLKVHELDTIKSSLESVVAAKDLDIKSKQEECIQVKEKLEKSRERAEEFGRQCLSLKDEHVADDFKVRNFDRVKHERDQLEKDKTSFERKYQEFELLSTTLKREKNVLSDHLYELKVKSRKQEQNISHLEGGLSDKTDKLSNINEEFQNTSRLWKQEQERNADLYDKYVAARGEITSLTQSLKDYQHETKINQVRLQELHNIEVSSNIKVEEISLKYETTTNELERVKSKYLHEKETFDLESKELRLAITSTSKSREVLVKQNAGLHQDLHSLQAVLNQEKISREKEISILNQQLQQAKQILSSYESLDDEYHDNIRTAADLPEHEARRAMQKLFPGLSIAGHRAVEQTVSLTRKVLQLERQNTEACSTIQRLTEGLERLGSSINSYKSALNMAGKPSSNLLQRITSQEDQIKALEAALQSNSLRKDQVLEENNYLRKDLEKLHEEFIKSNQGIAEVSSIRSDLIGLHQIHSSHTKS